ncbi:MAG: alcohol dehydrogenase catalytic domain-containing protein [Planctomycetes bacterium]|nr:alcohol dehydrogenase catalytic domain-containing protein [Planctomycetota bacterium]
MKALIFRDRRLAVVDDYPDPQPTPDEVVIDVTLAGICRTDIEVTRGYMDFEGVLGHECVGVVSRAGGAAGKKWQGRRVACEINCVCGKCDMCLAGLKTHCRRRTAIGIEGRDGCFAQRIAVPAANLHAVPPNVPDEVAVFAEPLAAAFQIIQQIRPSPRDTAVVIGDGRLGQLTAQVLASRGLRPMVVGKSRDKLRRLERLGIGVLHADEARPRGETHLVVEASGSIDGFRMAMDFVRPRGTIVLKSTLAGGEPLNLSSIVVNEVTVLGSRCGPLNEALAALANGSVTTEGMISATFPLADGVKAMETAMQPESLKVLLRP